MRTTWTRQLTLAVLFGCGLFAAPALAQAAEASCESDEGSCTINNDDGDSIDCTCDGTGAGSTGGDEWDGLDEEELSELCPSIIEDTCAGGDTDSTSVGTASDTDGDTDTDTDSDSDTDTDSDTDSDSDTDTDSDSDTDSDTDTDGPDTDTDGPDTDTDGPDTDSTTGTPATMTGASASGGVSDTDGDTESSSGGADEDDSGCGCSSGQDGKTGALMTLLAVLGFAARRRRK